jgi:hypothetical protein
MPLAKPSGPNEMPDLLRESQKNKKLRSKEPLMKSDVFFEVLDDFWKPLFLLLFFTGVRIGEAAMLK